MKPDKPQKVFLDASIVIQAGLSPGSRPLEYARRLAEAGVIEILTTDITIGEVANHHADRDHALIGKSADAKFRRAIEEAFDIELPEIGADELHELLQEKHRASARRMFERLSATVLSIDDVAPSVVFNTYLERSGFFAKEAKKYQFPDAFVFERVKAEADKNTPVIVVSNDSDFVQPVAENQHMDIAESLQDLFERLGLREDDPEIARFLNSHKPAFISEAENELRGRDVFAVGDGEVRVLNINDCDLSGMVSFPAKKGGNSILAVGEILLSVDIRVTFTFFGEEHTDSARAELKADASAEISVDAGGNPSSITALQLAGDSFEVSNIKPSNDGPSSDG